jgi:hypothetical protein
MYPFRLSLDAGQRYSDQRLVRLSCVLTSRTFLAKALKSQHLWKWFDAEREKRAVAGTRAIRSSRLAIAASRRSESSRERNEVIAASATSDLGWPREHVLCFAPTRSGKGVSWLSKKSSRPAARTCLVHARALADLQSAFAQMLHHLEFNDVSSYSSDVGGFQQERTTSGNSKSSPIGQRG